MDSVLPIGVAFTLGLTGALALTPLCRTIARRTGLLDHPGDRKVHRSPTPLLGGLAIFTATIGTFLIVTAFTDATIDTLRYGVAASGGLLLLTVGVFDDARTMRARHKLVLQVAVAGVIVGAGMRIEAVDFPSGSAGLGVASGPLTMLWIVALVNAWNLIDGLDGLATGLASIAAAAVGIGMLLAGEVAVAIVLFALTGACVGFLKYNFHPASIFLGDAGSMLLGYCLAVTPLLVSGSSYPGIHLGASLPLLIYFVPILDTVASIVRRTRLFIRIRSMWGLPVGELFRIVGGPDAGHLHHALLRRGLDQTGSVTRLWGLAGLLAGLALVPGASAGGWVILVSVPLASVWFSGTLGSLSPCGAQAAAVPTLRARGREQEIEPAVAEVENRRRAA